MGIHQSTTCRLIHRVTTAIASRRNFFICFPNEDERNTLKGQFFAVAGFPSVVGAIDGSHIPVQKPKGDNSELYRCRKGYFSINMQAVCDPCLKFRNIVCRWPGSTHDSRIFENSELCAKFEANEIDGLLVGDQGYNLKRYLMTPVRFPSTRPEWSYNKAHRKTRNCVERTFGVWKQRFPCLRIPLRTRIDHSLAIIISTSCLHNFAITHNDTNDFSDEILPENDDDSDAIQQPTRSGGLTRNQIINGYFD